ncbi:hypothetical protein GGX14DRAFT_553828 [Mycena pura]|uniref:Uncharacterized protein n=1 Tax=Mycena pura TaxID=153505 RepID=A0AAD6YVB6_9AGAR|nr:hypothetical protein GGX14DRAFT_553828 [Mycena pura]
MTTTVCGALTAHLLLMASVPRRLRPAADPDAECAPTWRSRSQRFLGTWLSLIQLGTEILWAAVVTPQMSCIVGSVDERRFLGEMFGRH